MNKLRQYEQITVLNYERNTVFNFKELDGFETDAQLLGPLSRKP